MQEQNAVCHLRRGSGNVRLCFRPSSVPAKEGRLYYQLVIRRKSFYHSSSYCIYPDEWDCLKGFVIAGVGQRTSELCVIRRRTKWEMQKLLDIIRQMTDSCVEPVFENIVREFEEQKAAQSFRAFVHWQVQRLQSSGRVRTAETYRSAYNSFIKFKGADDVLLYEFDDILVEDYEAYLLSNGLTPNSTSFYMRVLRTVLNKAVRQRLIPSADFFGNVYTGIGVTAKRAIGIEGLKKIRRLELSMSCQQDFARDMFMLSFYFRGMSFVDMANLRHTDLQNGNLTYHRKKTGQQLKIRWEQKMTQILDKYPKDEKYLLPILKSPDKDSRRHLKNISKQVNRWLKKVGGMAEIEIPLTMYVARHTWASIAKQKNVPISVISDALGHDSEKTTQIYLSTLDTSAVDDANSRILADL